jgi:hypothetical protein
MNNRNKNNIMRKILEYGFIAVVSCFLLSCDSNSERGEHFKEPRIVTDSDGKQWIVKHNMGDNYILQPMPKK